MVSFSTLSTIALLIASGVVAAPWDPTTKYHTHRTRLVGTKNVELNSYHPPSVFEGYGVEGTDHPLTKRGMKRATPEDAAKSFLQSKLNIGPDALQKLSGHSFEDMNYVYFSQVVNGIPCSNAVANVALKGDKVVSYGSSFVKIPFSETPLSTTPLLAAAQAILKAEELGGKYNNWPTKLECFVNENNVAVLVHVVQIQNMSSGAWKQVYIDATNGKPVNIVDFVAEASYTVVPLGNQDLTTGMKTIKDPQDLMASPSGWHESSGQYTGTTSGNNVVSYRGLDQNAALISIPVMDKLVTPPKLFAVPSKQSSADNNYDYASDNTKQPQEDPNVDAARVNTFYVVNAMHDLTYKYGFTEDASNFQQRNFAGTRGKPNDRVQVSIQDASGQNNANFATPPDGQPGQMRMFTWTKTVPLRDGALENDIVVHEMTHGISNRLTGGGKSTCLQSVEAGGMGEGWSDAMADIIEAKSNPLADYTLGSYVISNPAGIRSAPYSTNAATNSLKYDDIKTRNEVHAIGEVWANMLHILLAAFIRAYPQDAETPQKLSDPAAERGANKMLHLIIDGFKLQPCSPTFVQARDAIVQADANRYAGKHKCMIWNVFASRGLGQGAANYVGSSKVPEGC